LVHKASTLSKTIRIFSFWSTHWSSNKLLYFLLWQQRLTCKSTFKTWSHHKV